MLRKDRSFSKPEDFTNEISETMKTFEEFADYLRDEDQEAGQTGMLVATEYEAKMEKHLQCLQELFDEFRCSKGDPC